MNNDQDRRNQENDDIAAVPVTATGQRRFNPLWFLLLLLVPLFLLPYCHHRDPDQSALATPTPSAASLPSAAAASPASTPLPLASAPTTDLTFNPFTLNASGPDMGKAVLNFDVNATTPNAASSGILNAVVAYLQSIPVARISLTGYTDSSGSTEVNKRLTQQRVNTVKDALVGAGVDAGRIDTANFGEAYPVTDNSSPQARGLNRRVEISLTR